MRRPLIQSNKNAGELAENDLKQVAGGLTIKKVIDKSSPTFQNGVATASHPA